MVSWTVTRSPFCMACQFAPFQDVAQVRFGDEPYPVTGGLGNIFTDFLGRQTQRTDLGGKSRRSTNLTSGGTEGAVRILVSQVFHAQTVAKAGRQVGDPGGEGARCDKRPRRHIVSVMSSGSRARRGCYTYIVFTSLGSNLGAAVAGKVSRESAGVPSTAVATAARATYA